jgi:hypothetical protein
MSVDKNPFPGPQPYRSSDRERFYGRVDLSARLERSILAHRCMTVYGPSGAGKSSLVQASAIPSLIESNEIDVVRIDAWPPDENPTQWLADAMHANLDLGPRQTEIPPEQAIRTAAQRVARRSPNPMLIYLDQVEQLLYPSRNLGDVEAFFDVLGNLVDLPLRNLRVLLALREDYLGRFRDRLRQHKRLLDHGFRVGPLTVAEITAAVCQAASAGKPPQTWDIDATRALMLQVRVAGQTETDDAEAQAAYAQIVCRALFQQRAETGESSRELEAEIVLRDYLETTLGSLGPLRNAAQRLLEDHLVTADGARTLRTEQELLRILSAKELGTILRALESAAILHAEEHQGSRYFEIGHDWLARRVYEQRQARERDEANRERMAKDRAQKRRLAAVALVSLTIATLTGGLALWALQQKQVAEEAQRTSAEREYEAKKAQKEAEAQKKRAEELKVEADKEKRYAEAQAQKARQAAEEAQQAREKAQASEISAREAETQARVAETKASRAAKDAKASELQAIREKEKADAMAAKEKQNREALQQLIERAAGKIGSGLN